MLPDDVRDDTIELLAMIYKRIPWIKINTSKNAWDIWNHRVRAAATRANLAQYVSRLSNHFGLQHLPPEAINLVDKLKPFERKILTTIYAEHIPIAMHAAMRAKEMKEHDKAAKGDN